MKALVKGWRVAWVALSCGALAVGTAGCLGTAAGDPSAAACEGAPGETDAPLVAMLAQEGHRRLGLGETGERAVDMVIEAATARSARVMLGGIGDGRAGLGSVDTSFVEEGPNELMRKASLRCRAELLRGGHERISSRPLPSRLDLISALRDLDAAMPADGDRTLDLVLVGSALNTAVVDLRQPAVRRGPARSINRLARRGLNFSCKGWRVHMVGAGSDRRGDAGPAATSQLREWWRRYFRNCGGTLVFFAPQLSEFPAGATEIPPADRSLMPVRIVRERERVRATLSGDVLFAVDSAALRQGANAALRRLLPVIAESKRTIEVAGHTDSTGPDSVNQPLSLARARTVARWLTRVAGVPPARFEVRGFGSTDPVASNSTALGRAKNRRVIVTVD